MFLSSILCLFWTDSSNFIFRQKIRTIYSQCTLSNFFYLFIFCLINQGISPTRLSRCLSDRSYILSTRSLMNDQWISALDQLHIRNLQSYNQVWSNRSRQLGICDSYLRDIKRPLTIIVQSISLLIWMAPASARLSKCRSKVIGMVLLRSKRTQPTKVNPHFLSISKHAHIT